MNSITQVSNIIIRLKKLTEFFGAWKALQEYSPERRVRWEYRRIGTFPWNEGSPATPHLEFPYEYRIHPDELAAFNVAVLAVASYAEKINSNS